MDDPDSEATRSLVTRLKSGDRDALGPLLAKHAPYLRSIIRTRLGPRIRRRVGVSDVVQIAQLDALEQVKDFVESDRLPFRWWLRKAAQRSLQRVLAQHLDAQKRDVRREIPLPDKSSLCLVAGLASGSPSPSQHVINREQAERVRCALALDALDQVYLSESDFTLSGKPDLSRDLLEKGLGFYEQFAAENEDNSDLCRETGRALARAGVIYRVLRRTNASQRMLDAAVTTLEKAVQLQPDQAEARVKLGQVLRIRGQGHEAKEAYRAAIRVDPKCAAAYGGLGLILCDDGQRRGDMLRPTARGRPEHGLAASRRAAWASVYLPSNRPEYDIRSGPVLAAR